MFSVEVDAEFSERVTIDDPLLLIEVNPGKQAVVAGAADHVMELGFAAGEVDPSFAPRLEIESHLAAREAQLKSKLRPLGLRAGLVVG
jgi:hypothetical protein